MSSTEASFVSRVRIAVALTASLAALLTLGVTIILVDRSEVQSAEQAAAARASQFIAEVVRDTAQGEFFGPKQFEEEILEFTHGGVTLTVFENGAAIAGSLELPQPKGAGCEVTTLRDGDWLICSQQFPSRVITVAVAEPMAQVLAHRRPLLFGGALALLIAALGGALVGLVAGRWAVQPLTELYRAIQKVNPYEPQEGASLPRCGFAELNEIAVALEKLLAALSEELARSRRFASNAAHELRTPLTRLRTRLELLGEKPPQADALQAEVEVLLSNIDALVLLAERLLLLGSPRDDLRGNGSVALAELAQEALNTLDPNGERVSLKVEGRCVVQGDPSVLQIMVNNALANALKYSLGEVRLNVVETASIAIVTVEDEGPGIPDELKERAFEPFYRAPGHRDRPGHGIGLNLIAHIVAAHRGHACFGNSAKGARLEMHIPMQTRG